MPTYVSLKVAEKVEVDAISTVMRQSRAKRDAIDMADPVNFSRRAGIEPDPWQADLLRSGHKRVLLNASRQSGKSTTLGTLAAHTALFQPGSPILLLSPSLRQSQELFRKTLDAYRASGRPVPAEAETKLTLELTNGSRVMALPGSEGTTRGFSGVRLLVIDEASRVDDDLYRSVRPMLAVSDGTIIAPSTPFGKRGWWYEAWVGDEPWHRVEIPATMCPRIPASFLAEERRNLPELWFEQEYLCQFSDTTNAVFAHAAVMAALSGDVQPLFGAAS